MADIRIIFVLPNDAEDESNASEIMIQAYESCEQLVENISWVKEKDLSKLKFSKLDYLVFENFEGRNFENFIESKCAILGPMAISVCLMEGKAIPSFQWPFLNVAMYGCEVSCSGLSKKDKDGIKDKIKLMGGFYTANFTDTITHLICDGTKSEKYIIAARKGVKLMLPSWVDHVFELSRSNKVYNATDPKIIEKFKCPPFHKLTICSTGIQSSRERQKLSDTITANGGTLAPKLSLQKTDILICHGSAGTNSDKYKAARNTQHISCVTIDWVLDSIEKGYSLPPEDYRIKTLTSTPTKEGENIDPNFSTVSAIGGHLNLRKQEIDETVNSTYNANNETKLLGKKISNKRKADEELVEKIDIKKVKSAGNFLDGCSIFVAGFSPVKRDKLNKIINISGATRYDNFSDRVSHVIIGDPNCSEINTIKAMNTNCCLVSIEWLLDSVELQKPVDEVKYLILNGDTSEDADKTNVGSPLSKKVLSFLHPGKQPPFKDDQDKTEVADATTENDPLTQRYLKTNNKEEEEDTLAKILNNDNYSTLAKASDGEDFNIKSRTLTRKNDVQDNNQTVEFRPQDTSTQVSEVTTDISDNCFMEPIFNSLKLSLVGFDEETTDSYKKYIETGGGTVVDKRFKGVCDYLIIPVVMEPLKLPPAQEILNNLWLVDCIEAETFITDVQYYHKPIELPSADPLKGCVITLSVYTGGERTFLRTIIEGLGGIFQEVFSRKTIEAKQVLASTHLLSPEASGKKYEAALRWDIPVINKDWVLECLKTKQKLPIDNFLVGDSSTQDNSDASESRESTDEKSDRSTREKSVFPIEKSDTLKQEESSNMPMKEKSDAPVGKWDKFKQDASTPKCTKNLQNDSMKTPVHQILNLNNKNTPERCSQVTPINKILQDAINSKVLPTPPSPKTYFPWEPKTPDTPIGSFIKSNPSPGLRKEMQIYVNAFPDFVPPKRRLSTPISELKRRLRNKVLSRDEYSQPTQASLGTPPGDNDGENINALESEESYDSLENAEEKQPSIENLAVHQKLQEIKQKVMASGSSSATKRSSRMFESTSSLPGIEKTNVDVQSQVFTVGWDYGEEKTQNPQQKVFMLSGVASEQRKQLTNNLINLGAVVLDVPSYDPSCTHLIVVKAGKNEKFLACMAAGKWILHVSYVDKSAAAGQFLNEEEFEFGNPKAKSNIFYEDKDSCVHFWRREIERRGYGAFNDMRAIVIAENKEPITKVIEAGGGVVVNIPPPYEDSVHATHCLLEIKTVRDFSQFVPLAEQGIKCVNTIFINDFLWRCKKGDADYIIPYFSRYYR